MEKTRIFFMVRAEINKGKAEDPSKGVTDRLKDESENRKGMDLRSNDLLKWTGSG